MKEKDGILIAISDHLKEVKSPMRQAEGFIDVHHEVMKNYKGHKPSDFLEDSKLMSQVQRDFYDRAALLYQKMDELDLQGGGIHWMRMNRYFNYDRHLLKGKKKMLYIGMGNGRLARKFAIAGFDVWGTDISFEILKVGKTINDKIGVPMHYIQHNAEEKFPFPDESFDCTYSCCTANHIVNWNNYFGEQYRVLKKGGMLLCRMPNSHLWWFWDKQGELRDGVEVKADYCNMKTAREVVKNLYGMYLNSRKPRLGFELPIERGILPFVLLDEFANNSFIGYVWTHDRQYNIIPAWVMFSILRRHLKPLFKVLGGFQYAIRTFIEDHFRYLKTNEGIYTMLEVRK